MMTTSPGDFNKVTRPVFCQAVAIELGGLSMVSHGWWWCGNVQSSKGVWKARASNISRAMLTNSAVRLANIWYICIPAILVLLTDCYNVCDGNFNDLHLVIEWITRSESAHDILES
jgi:hypothetical protein